MQILIKCIGYRDNSLTRGGINLKRKKRFEEETNRKKTSLSLTMINHSPILPAFSSLNISKMLSHFMTFRSTIRDLSSSLQRMEKMLDSAYQMFEITQNIIGTRINLVNRFYPRTRIANHPVKMKKIYP